MPPDWQSNEEIKTTEKNPLDLVPKELEVIKPLVKPAVKAGKKTGNFLSDVIDWVVDEIF